MVDCALTIAGSDSGGGAGVQADLKTFLRLGVYGASVITAVTAQNTIGVQDVFVLPAKIIAAQIDSVMGDICIKAVKTGMLANTETIEIVAAKASCWKVKKLVVDPVMVAASGYSLLDKEAESMLRERILPLAHIVTPNIPEAEILSGIKFEGSSDSFMREACRKILSFGPRWVLLKGGHLQGDKSVDLLYDGSGFTDFSAERVTIHNPHGTGCTLSAAITACLVKGLDLPEAVGRAKKYLTCALRHSYAVGKGVVPVNNIGEQQEA